MAKVQRTKNLALGETKIADIPYYDEKSGKQRVYELYYGRVTKPIINGKMLNVDEKAYLKYLKEFLMSEDGLTYIVPNMQKIKEDTETMLQRMKQKSDEYNEKMKGRSIGYDRENQEASQNNEAMQKESSMMSTEDESMNQSSNPLSKMIVKKKEASAQKKQQQEEERRALEEEARQEVLREHESQLVAKQNEIENTQDINMIGATSNLPAQELVKGRKIMSVVVFVYAFLITVLFLLMFLENDVLIKTVNMLGQ